MIKAYVKTSLLHTASCEKRVTGDIQATRSRVVDVMVWAKTNLEITAPYSRWILSISSDNSRYMDKKKELKISQRGYPLITSIFSWKKLQGIQISKSGSKKAEIWLRCAVAIEARKVKLFSYKSGKIKLKDLCSSGDQPNAPQNILLAISFITKLGHLICVALYNCG